MTEATLSAYRETNNRNYRTLAQTIFNCFLGKNTQNAIVYNSATGGCYDGITEEGLNYNQGAESTICNLSARVDLQLNAGR